MDIIISIKYTFEWRNLPALGILHKDKRINLPRKCSNLKYDGGTKQWAIKYMKQKMLELKGGADKSTVRDEDSSIPSLCNWQNS